MDYHDKKSTLDKGEVLSEIWPTIVTALCCAVVVTTINVTVSHYIVCDTGGASEDDMASVVQVCDGPACLNNDTGYDGATEYYVTQSTDDDVASNGPGVTDELISNAGDNSGDDHTGGVTGNGNDVTDDSLSGVTYESVYGYGVDCRRDNPPTTQYRSNVTATPRRTTGDVDDPIGICEAALYAHNKLRWLHMRTDPFVYDVTLATQAEAIAIREAEADALVLDDEESEMVHYSVGRSLYISPYVLDVDEAMVAYDTIADAVFHWYKWDECGLDRFTGEYTGCVDIERSSLENILWRSSTRVGCGMAFKSKSRPNGNIDYVTVVACEYSPARSGRILTNVAPPTEADFEVQISYDLEAQGHCIDKMTYNCASHDMCRATEADETLTERRLMVHYCRKTCICAQQ